jgi:hypothetical protein
VIRKSQEVTGHSRSQAHVEMSQRIPYFTRFTQGNKKSGLGGQNVRTLQPD